MVGCPDNVGYLIDMKYSVLISMLSGIDPDGKLSQQGTKGGKPVLSSKYINIFYGGLLFVLIGCASSTTNYRVEGFKLTTKSFDAIASTPDLNETIEIKNMKIHIVGDRSRFPWEKAAAYGSPIHAYATTNNEIFVLGKRLGDKIVVNQAILGHELNHLLNFSSSKVADPDRLDHLEWCSVGNLPIGRC